MPFDSTPIKFNLSLNGLILWLKTKPVGERYDWDRSNDCVLTQFVRAAGYVGFSPYCYACAKLGDNVAIAISLKGEHTMGAALERATLYQKTHK